MNLYDWEQTVREWAARRRNVPPSFANDTVAFFRLAFDHTAFPDRSWFGVHQSVASLVVGNIWLASVNFDSSAKGIWLLCSEPGSIADWDFDPTRSTAQSTTPLYWGHTSNLADIAATHRDTKLWYSFAEATRDVFNAAAISGDRDATQLKRGKVRLSDFWSPSALANKLVLERSPKLRTVTPRAIALEI